MKDMTATECLYKLERFYQINVPKIERTLQILNKKLILEVMRYFIREEIQKCDREQP